ncbi:MAG TPA: hemerythrin domain-containing protein [Thermoplasmata archaeon]|nr:hemerythrin domain-containing protein [Thermoplasmata archaeon]
MEDPNDVLKAEHEAIELLLAAVEGMAGRVATKAVFPRRDLEAAMTVVTEFADKCHHAKEERTLFPVLSKHSPKVGAELARRLTSDHVAFRKLVGTMKEQIAKGGTEDRARSQLAKNLDTYTRLLRQHILVENTELLPEVEKSIPAAERTRLSEAFERVEREEIGAGVHEKYHHMIHTLADRYAR